MRLITALLIMVTFGVTLLLVLLLLVVVDFDVVVELLGQMDTAVDITEALLMSSGANETKRKRSGKRRGTGLTAHEYKLQHGTVAQRATVVRGPDGSLFINGVDIPNAPGYRLEATVVGRPNTFDGKSPSTGDQLPPEGTEVYGPFTEAEVQRVKAALGGRMVIYLWYCIATGLTYIGMTGNAGQRVVQQYLSPAYIRSKDSTSIYSAFEEYGNEGFLLFILQDVLVHAALAGLEAQWCLLLDPFLNDADLMQVGIADNRAGAVNTPEHNANIQAARSINPQSRSDDSRMRSSMSATNTVTLYVYDHTTGAPLFTARRREDAWTFLGITKGKLGTMLRNDAPRWVVVNGDEVFAYVCTDSDWKPHSDKSCVPVSAETKAAVTWYVYNYTTGALLYTAHRKEDAWTFLGLTKSKLGTMMKRDASRLVTIDGVHVHAYVSTDSNWKPQA